MRPPPTWYVAIAIASSGWVLLIGWLWRDLDCDLESCALQLTIMWGGLTIIFLASAVAITRRLGRIHFASLAILAAVFTLSTSLALVGWSFARDSTDATEVLLITLVLIPVAGIPLTLLVALTVSALTLMLWPQVPRSRAENP